MSEHEDELKARKEAERKMLELAVRLYNSQQIVINPSFKPTRTTEPVPDIVVAHDDGAQVILEAKTYLVAQSRHHILSEAFSSMPQPPKLLQRILWTLLPARDREPILGDALETYYDTFRKFGSRPTATFDYAKEVLYTIVGCTWRKLIEVIVLLRRGH